MTMPLTAGLFRRAILQSTPFGQMSRTLQDSLRIGRRLLDVLGLKPGETEKLKSLPFRPGDSQGPGTAGHSFQFSAFPVSCRLRCKHSRTHSMHSRAK